MSAYSDGGALWTAVTDQAKAAAQVEGIGAGVLVRRFVFERFLGRVFHDPSGPWVLKGGTAILSRVHDARTTKDLDLLSVRNDVDTAVDALRAAVAIDLGDHFRFVITKIERNLGGAVQPMVDGRRVSVDGYCGAAKKGSFAVDLVTGSLLTTAPELRADPVLVVRGLEAPVLRLYPVVDHIADKLCAMQARYGAKGDRPSSRVRDLVDLVVLARSQDIDGTDLIAATRGEWTYRGLPGTPGFAPPLDWDRLYPLIARSVPAVADVTSFAAAVALVGGFLAPVLDGRAAGWRWTAATLTWSRSPA